jgi:uncharacterized protein YraI
VIKSVVSAVAGCLLFLTGCSGHYAEGSGPAPHYYGQAGFGYHTRYYDDWDDDVVVVHPRRGPEKVRTRREKIRQNAPQIRQHAPQIRNAIRSRAAGRKR